MPMLHDPAFLESAKTRLKAIRPDTPGKWGEMSVDQALWHVNAVLENAVGRFPIAPIKVPLPHWLLKIVVFNLPWRRGKTPTAPEFIAKGHHDFEKERNRMLALLDEFAARPIKGAWGDSAFLGTMTGTEWSRLQGKHVDHHLQQFGV
jgi:Protein of unknown function (DUF1569)